MSKSLGNVVCSSSDLLSDGRPVELRYYLGAAHYRSTIDYSDEALREAASAYQRIEGFVQRAAEVLGRGPSRDAAGQFAAAMDDDLGVPQALAVVHDTVRRATPRWPRRRDTVSRRRRVRAMLGVLGLDPLSPPWRGAAGDHTDVVDALVSLAMQQRTAARERKDSRPPTPSATLWPPP